jgi:uncharacterized protein Yka (UPF0111/DUF47 family)
VSFDQLGTILAPMATILAASAWIHNSLNRLAVKVEVLASKLDDYGERIRRIEHELDQIRRNTNGRN